MRRPAQHVDLLGVPGERRVRVAQAERVVQLRRGGQVGQLAGPVHEAGDPVVAPLQVVRELAGRDRLLHHDRSGRVGRRRGVPGAARPVPRRPALRLGTRRRRRAPPRPPSWPARRSARRAASRPTGVPGLTANDQSSSGQRRISWTNFTRTVSTVAVGVLGEPLRRGVDHHERLAVELAPVRQTKPGSPGRLPGAESGADRQQHPGQQQGGQERVGAAGAGGARAGSPRPRWPARSRPARDRHPTTRPRSRSRGAVTGSSATGGPGSSAGPTSGTPVSVVDPLPGVPVTLRCGRGDAGRTVGSADHASAGGPDPRETVGSPGHAASAGGPGSRDTVGSREWSRRPTTRPAASGPGTPSDPRTPWHRPTTRPAASDRETRSDPETRSRRPTTQPAASGPGTPSDPGTRSHRPTTQPAASDRGTRSDPGMRVASPDHDGAADRTVSAGDDGWAGAAVRVGGGGGHRFPAAPDRLEQRDGLLGGRGRRGRWSGEVPRLDDGALDDDGREPAPGGGWPGDRFRVRHRVRPDRLGDGLPARQRLGEVLGRLRSVCAVPRWWPGLRAGARRSRVASSPGPCGGSTCVASPPGIAKAGVGSPPAAVKAWVGAVKA